MINFTNSLTDQNKLGGQNGYGILIVEGDLVVHGGLTFVVSGRIDFSGGGEDSVNITGGIMSGETTTATSDFGGSMKLEYANMNDLFKEKFGTVRTTAWREVRN